MQTWDYAKSYAKKYLKSSRNAKRVLPTENCHFLKDRPHNVRRLVSAKCPSFVDLCFENRPMITFTTVKPRKSFILQDELFMRTIQSWTIHSLLKIYHWFFMIFSRNSYLFLRSPPPNLCVDKIGSRPRGILCVDKIPISAARKVCVLKYIKSDLGRAEFSFSLISYWKIDKWLIFK